MGSKRKYDKCFICVGNITKSHFSVQCDKCKESFHQKCIEITEMELEVLKKLSNKWLCKGCNVHTRNEIRKSMGDFSNNKRTGSQNPESESLSDPTQGSSKHDEIIENLKELKAEVRDLKKDLQFYADQYEIQKKKNAEFTGEIEKLKCENNKLGMEMARLRGQQDFQGLEQRASNLILVGINSSIEEVKNRPAELKQKTEKVLKYVVPNLPMDRVTIKILSQFRDNSPIMVTLNSADLRESILEGRRNKGHITNDKCGLTGNNPIFINEDMTRETRELYREARLLRNKGIKYVWAKNGKIFVRKGDNQKAIHIKSHEDIKSLNTEENQE